MSVKRPHCRSERHLRRVRRPAWRSRCSGRPDEPLRGSPAATFGPADLVSPIILISETDAQGSIFTGWGWTGRRWPVEPVRRGQGLGSELMSLVIPVKTDLGPRMVHVDKTFSDTDWTGGTSLGSTRVQDLRYFLVLAEELSFTRAAARVFLSQQAFSARIKLLERQLGVPLFVRTSRHVALTAEGSKLTAPIQEAVELLDASWREARAIGDGRDRPLKVGMHMYGAGELTPRILDAFAEQAPDIRVELHELKLGTMTSVARDDSVDLAIARLPVPADGANILELVHEPIVIAVSRRDPLAGRSAVTVHEALQEPVVIVRGTEPEFTDYWLLRKLRDEPFVVGATVDTFVEEMEAVAAGRGCSFAPAAVARFVVHSEIRYVPIVDGPRSTVVLAWRNPGPPAQSIFIEVVRRVVESERDVIAAIEAGLAPQA